MSINNFPWNKRSSSVLCKNFCEFLTISYEGYLLIKHAYNKKYYEKENFLSKALPSFGSLTINKIESIYCI